MYIELAYLLCMLLCNVDLGCWEWSLEWVGLGTGEVVLFIIDDGG